MRARRSSFAARGRLDRKAVARRTVRFRPGPPAALGGAGLQVGARPQGNHAALSERDETAEICTDARGNPEPDPGCATPRTSRSVRTSTSMSLVRRPLRPRRWVDHAKTKVGYEITRHFMNTSHRARWRRSTPIAERLIAEIQDLFAELDG